MATPPKAPPGTRAAAATTASDQRSRMVLDQVEKERIATDAKTVRLKALRLAKEAEEAAVKAAEPVKAKAKKKVLAKRCGLAFLCLVLLHRSPAAPALKSLSRGRAWHSYAPEPGG